MPKPQRGNTTVAAALARAFQSEGAKLPKRFTVNGEERIPVIITDTQTGRTSEMMPSCFGTVRRVLSELFPDEPTSG